MVIGKFASFPSHHHLMSICCLVLDSHNVRLPFANLKSVSQSCSSHPLILVVREGSQDLIAGPSLDFQWKRITFIFKFAGRLLLLCLLTNS
jgi:hypothetical protein